MVLYVNSGLATLTFILFQESGELLLLSYLLLVHPNSNPIWMCQEEHPMTLQLCLWISVDCYYHTLAIHYICSSIDTLYKTRLLSSGLIWWDCWLGHVDHLATPFNSLEFCPPVLHSNDSSIWISTCSFITSNNVLKLPHQTVITQTPIAEAKLSIMMSSSNCLKTPVIYFFAVWSSSVSGVDFVHVIDHQP